MTKLIKYAWHQKIFFVEISKETLSLYLHSIGPGDTNNEAFHLSLALYNLANLIKLELANILNGITLVAITQVNNHSLLNETFQLSLNCNGIDINFCIHGTGLQGIIDLYYASKIHLEKINKIEHLLETIYHKYQIDIVKDTNSGISQERFVSCKTVHNGYFERFYISIQFAEYIYKKCYPHYVPFDCSTYNLTLIRNIINLWFRTTLKIQDLTIVAITLTTLPVKQYNAAVIKNDDFLEKIFFQVDSSLFATLKTDFTALANKDKNNENVISLQQKLNFNVTKYLFNLSINQLKNLKINDVILLTEGEIMDGVKISCGNKYLSADIVGENKLIVRSIS